MKKIKTFPGNPMASNIISDRLQALKGGDVLSITVREAAQNNNLTGAIKLVLECYKDNKQMAVEIFGEDLIRDIKKFVRERKAEQALDDIPANLYKQPGVFGYLAD